LVSNALAKGWEDHKSATYTQSPHGFAALNFTDTNGDYNKLMSNAKGKDWEDRIAGLNDFIYEELSEIISGIQEDIETLTGRVTELAVEIFSHTYSY
jgi:hypothetical protein